MPQVNNLSHADALKLAGNMRSKMRNAAMERKTLVSHLTRIAGAPVGGFALGRIMGAREYEYELNEVQIEAGEMADPRQWMGVDIELIAAAVTTSAGLAAQGLLGNVKGLEKIGAPLAASVEGAGIGMLGAYFYSMGHEQGQTAAEEGDIDIDAVP